MVVRDSKLGIKEGGILERHEMWLSRRVAYGKGIKKWLSRRVAIGEGVKIGC